MVGEDCCWEFEEMIVNRRVRWAGGHRSATDAAAWPRSHAAPSIAAAARPLSLGPQSVRWHDRWARALDSFGAINSRKQHKNNIT